MGYSKPSVSRAVNLLKNNGFINVSKEGYLTLTKSGEENAKKMITMLLDMKEKFS